MPGHTVHSLLHPHNTNAYPSTAPHHTHHPVHAQEHTPDYPTLVIRNVHLPFESDDPTLADPLYNVYCVGSRVDRVELSTPHGSRSVSHSSNLNM